MNNSVTITFVTPKGLSVCETYILSKNDWTDTEWEQLNRHSTYNSLTNDMIQKECGIVTNCSTVMLY